MYRITETRFYSKHGRIVGNDGDAATSTTIAVSAAEKKKEKKNIRGGRMVEIQDRRITNARRPSFVVGALTANSKLR